MKKLSKVLTVIKLNFNNIVTSTLAANTKNNLDVTESKKALATVQKNMNFKDIQPSEEEVASENSIAGGDSAKDAT